MQHAANRLRLRALAAAGFLSVSFVCGLRPARAEPAPAPEAASAAAPGSDAAKFFESKVRPLLVEHCSECHGQSKQKGGLRVDSLAALLAGGESGPALTPGRPDESLLVTAVRYTDDELRMPPKQRLPADKVQVIEAWVRSGAVWPGAAPRELKLHTRERIGDADRAYWAYQPLRDAPPPEPINAGPWSDHPIDRFLMARLQEAGLTPAPRADRVTLIRRAFLDLTGLPPPSERVRAFERDGSPDAWERLIDELLASPRYGERWGRHWLDLVRFAESDGFRQDALRPHAWRYRDYVIRAFNDDKPYDRFVLEQLAGDEAFPGDPEARVAAGFLRLPLYEYNQRDVELQWDTVLNDITDVVGDVFLGTGVHCAQCHDHKFDPVLRKDYYALRAFFASMRWVDEAPVATPAEVESHRAALAAWEEKTASIRRELAALEAPARDRAERGALDKFPPSTQAIWAKPPRDRSPLERLYADLIQRQVSYEHDNLKLGKAEKEKADALKQQLQAFASLKPAPLPLTDSVEELGPTAAPTFVPGDRQRREVPPGFLTVLFPRDASVDAVLTPSATGTGRRTALAQWITRPDHPLATRVMINRIWQHHFGRGIVATPNDLGALGEPPTHPELLDWLARRFVQAGWRLKPMHRLIMTSQAYQQASRGPTPPQARLTDPQNRLLWKFPERRLEAEAIRDALLAITGELKPSLGGPSVTGTQSVRSVFVRVIRNSKDPFLDAFDAADGFSSTPQRNITTTAPQALLMFNGEFALARAEALASKLIKSHGEDPQALVHAAHVEAFSRAPDTAQLARGVAFLGGSTTTQPSPTASPSPAPMATEDFAEGGKAWRIHNADPAQTLKLAQPLPLPAAGFTVEAVVQLESLYKDASVRVIASQWNGDTKSPGWSLGVTSEKSRHTPRNLILQLASERGVDVVASGLYLPLNRPCYVAVSVTLEAQPRASFYMKDLSDNASKLQTAQVKLNPSPGLAAGSAFVLGGRDGPKAHGWDGLIDELRWVATPLKPSQLLPASLMPGDPDNAPPAADLVLGHWRFEGARDPFADDSPHRRTLAPVAAASRGGEPMKGAQPELLAALAQYCHVLLNANEFLYLE